MTTETAVNYTEEMVSTLTQRYTDNPTAETVNALAVEMGKTSRSVVAKLSNLGIYVAKGKTTKTGAAVVRKADLVDQIEQELGIEVESFEKASKADLEALVAAIYKLTVEDES